MVLLPLQEIKDWRQSPGDIARGQGTVLQPTEAVVSPATNM